MSDTHGTFKLSKRAREEMPGEQVALATLATTGLIAGAATMWVTYRPDEWNGIAADAGQAAGQVLGPLLLGFGAACLIAFLMVGALRQH